mgnify:CR=1 FL=1
MQIAALGSLCLHAAVLSLPLGGAPRERGFPLSSTARTIRATLRPLVPEPTRAPDPSHAVADVRAPAATGRVAGTEAAQATTSGPGPQSASALAIPATFFDPSRLTEIPRPLEEPALDLLLPILSRPGVARLILLIDESGRVTSVEIESATLPQNVAQRAADIFAGLRFSPGRIGSSAVKSRVRITVGAEERKSGG